MALSFWDALGIVLDESFSNFIEMLVLSGISVKTWILIVIGISFIPITAIFLYKKTNHLSEKKPFHIKSDAFLQFSFCLFLSLFFWDFFTSPTIRSDVYQTYQKALPWKMTFLSRKTHSITFLPLSSTSSLLGRGLGGGLFSIILIILASLLFHFLLITSTASTKSQFSALFEFLKATKKSSL
jgi:hypothetical protein